MLRQESACTHLYIYFHHTLETHCSLCPERDQLTCSSGHVTKDHTHAVLMVSLREQTHCSHGDWVSLREHVHCSHALPQRTDTLFLWPPSENRHANLMVSLREQTRLCPDRETASKVCQLARADTHCVQDKLLLPEHYSSLAHVLCACCILLLHPVSYTHLTLPTIR